MHGKQFGYCYPERLAPVTLFFFKKKKKKKIGGTPKTGKSTLCYNISSAQQTTEIICLHGKQFGYCYPERLAPVTLFFFKKKKKKKRLMALPKPENQRYAVTFRLHNKQTNKKTKKEKTKQNKTKKIYICMENNFKVVSWCASH